MNAQELFDLVKIWPREAWPEGVTWNELLWDGKVTNASWVIDLCTLSVPHAVMLFESAGLRWLAKNGCVRGFWHCGDHWHLDHQSNRGTYLGEHNDCPVWLIGQAISQAIESVNPKEVPSG